jgi:hypothetical protein
MFGGASPNTGEAAMNSSGTLAVALSAVVWFATPTFAELAGVPRSSDWESENGAVLYVLYVLEGASAQALERARMNKGSRKSCCLMKNVELTDLIERLKHGEHVTLEEIENAVDGLLDPELNYQPVAFAGCH